MKERTWPLTLRLMWPDWSLGFLSSSWEDGFATPDILLRSGDPTFPSTVPRSPTLGASHCCLYFIRHRQLFSKLGSGPNPLGLSLLTIWPITKIVGLGASSFDRRYRPCLIRFIEAKCNILSKMIFSYLFYHKKKNFKYN